MKPLNDTNMLKTQPAIANRRSLMLTMALIMWLMLTPCVVTAQSLQQMWIDVEDARHADKPKTEIEYLDKIIKKASKEKAYGHLMRAELMTIQAKNAISPDSLEPAFFRLVEKAEAQKDKLLRAVYHAVVGKVINSSPEASSLSEKKASYYFDIALADPMLLSKTKSSKYQPLVVMGNDGNIYDHDLLSTIALEAKRPQVMRDCYNQQPKRRKAALMATLETFNREVHYNYYRKYGGIPIISQLDSLMTQYGDLPECGEVAICKWRIMDHAYEVSDQQKYEFLQQAISRWGNYSRIDILRNALDELERPLLEVVQGYEYVLPGKPKFVRMPQMKGISHLKVEITRVNIGKETQYSLFGKTYWNMLEKYAVKGSHKVLLDKHYEQRPTYEIFSDSLWIEGMPAGVYFIDYITDNHRLDTIHNYLHVTDIALLMQPLPNNGARLAVLNSTTGQPMANAHIDLRDKYGAKNAKFVTVNCDSNAETVVDGRANKGVYFAYTDDDWGYREQEFKNTFRYWGKVDDEQFVNLFTDRAIYRPGQKVHVAAISVNNTSGIKTTVASGRIIELTLVNAQGKTIEKRMVETDSYGTAHTDFQLPEKGLNGTYKVTAGSRESVSFLVEEYKRPTFYVEIEKPTITYQDGDTLTLVGKARTYSGMSVQGAKVSYRVERSQAYFWWRQYPHTNNKTILTEKTVTTDGNGVFTMRVPISLPSGTSRNEYYNFKVTAEVTDLGGETRNSQCVLPLGSRPRNFHVEMPEKVLRDSLPNVTFTLLNAMGQPVADRVQYTVERLSNPRQVIATRTVDSNMPVAITSTTTPLPSGVYRLVAICGSDTLAKKMTVFSLNDTKPVAPTNDWFYVSSNEFPREGKPVYVQVGSSDNVHILYTVLSGEKVVDMGHLDLNNAVKTLSFVYQEEYQEGINIAMSWVKDTVFYHHEATIKRPLPEKKLKMEWTTFRDKLIPGQTETWTLRVRQSNGKPARAQLLATLYDKSLEQLRSHQWDFDHRLRQNLPSSAWAMGYIYRIKDTESPKLEPREVADLHFDHFGNDIFDFGGYRILLSPMKGGAIEGGRIGRDMSIARESAMVDSTTGQTDDGASADPTKPNQMSPRTNFNETAFFYPSLTTDATGQIAIKFTLPEAVTTWRFMGLAHDKDLNIGMLEGEAIAAKTVMVQPNVPRFIRQNDEATITSRIANTTAHEVSGQTLLELIDPATEKVVFSQQQPFRIGANGTSAVAYNLSAFTRSNKALNSMPLICRITATGKGFSDGEQHYLPILPDVEQVMNTRVITQHEPSEVNVDLKQLIPQGKTLASAGSPTLTIEYADNPAWMMVQTLPAVAADKADNAISLASTYYANSIAGWLLNSSPVIRNTIEQWKQHQTNGNGASLTSELGKNEELKNILLAETPWMLDAENESDNMRQLTDYFDAEELDGKLSATLLRLGKLQHNNGSFAWMTGMFPSVYATQAVAHILARQQSLIGENKKAGTIFNKALSFLGEMANKEILAMQNTEKETGRKCQPSEFLIDYLYVRALIGSTPDDLTRFVVDRLKEMTADLTIYGKATASVVLAHFGEKDKAREFLESMIEYSVYTDELGRYFDTRRAYSSWFDYKIPTSVACIEAMKLVDGTANQQYIEQMQRWLLQEKRTQAWDTPINSVNAAYAFLKDNLTSLEQNGQPAQITIDGKPLQTSAQTTGLGYVKSTENAAGKDMLTVRKTSPGTSWGAVYARFYQSVADIEASQEGLSIKREVVSINGKPVSNQQGAVTLQVGDRITMRIVITANRDYDFVQVTDKRAACLEPVSQISGYQKGCYVSPRDNVTNYFFDMLPKGKREMETDYYVDRPGTYQSGTVTVQCAYAPAFSARDKAITFKVEK